MENRLQRLMKDASITYRELSKYVDIDYSALSKIAKNKYDLSTKQINSLVDFFSCTSDFLLYISKNGIFVSYEGGGLVMTIDEYEKIRDEKVLVSIIDKRVIRSIKDSDFIINSLNEINEGVKSQNETLNYLVNLEMKMSEKQLKNIIKFIEMFILNNKE